MKMAPGVAMSVIVVTCQRLTELRRCLTALRAHLQEPGVPTTEVLTVHAPGDELAMAAVRSEFPFVRVIGSAIRNLCVQRNLGAQAAAGEVIVYLDDDAWPRPGWLQALAAAFVSARTQVATGPVLHEDGRRQYGPMAVTPLVRQLALPDGTAVPDGMAPTVPGCNFAVRRSMVFATGGFDEQLSIHSDDVDFCIRAFAAVGGDRAAFTWVPAAGIHHEPAPGPFRRTRWDRDWRTVARDSIYLAFRHGQARRWWRLGLPLLIQIPKLLRFPLWLLLGRLGPRAFGRCVLRHLIGLVEGYRKGWSTSPRLPLRPLPTAVSGSTPGHSAATEEASCATSP
ncbi:MAG: glycosyltransferase [Planctomycetes bacterium]|nr:glycosyltransferase [Planctomycetota bacterium]